MNIARVLMVCVAFAGGFVGTASSDDALPGGAILRLGSTKYRQAEGRTPSTLTPDGRSILQYQSPNTLRYISVETGKETHTIKLKKPLRQGVYTFQITPNGQRLIVDCDDRIYVIDPRTGEILWSHKIIVHDMARYTIATDGKAERFAYALEANGKCTGKIRVCSTRNGEKIAEFDVLQSSTVRVMLSNDGKQLATHGVHYLRDEKVEASSGVVQIWDIDKSIEIAKIRTTSSHITGVQFSVDGKRVYTSGENTPVEEWDVATGKSLRRLTTRSGREPELFTSPGGTKLASASKDGHVQVWETATGRRLGSGAAHVIHGVKAIAFPADGPAVAFGRFGSALQLWTIPGKTLTPQQGHFGTVSRIAYANGGKEILTTGDDNKFVRWDAKTGKELASYGHCPHAINRWEAKWSTMMWENGIQWEWSINDAILAPDGEAFYFPNGGGLALVNLKTGQEQHTLYATNGDAIDGRFEISADGRRIVANSTTTTRADRYSTDVWDATTGQSIFDYTFSQDKKSILRIDQVRNAITPDGTKLVSLVYKRDPDSEADQLEFFTFDLRTKAKIGQSLIATDVGPGHIVLAAMDNRSALVFHKTESLAVWDIPTAKFQRKIPFEGYPYLTCFSPSGRLLAIAGWIDDDKSPTRYFVRIIEWASGQVRREIPLESIGQSLCFSPDGTQLAVGTNDSTVLIFDVGESREPLPLIEALHTPDELTDAIRGDSAKRAWDAIRELSTRPEVAIPLIAAKIQPISKLAKPTPEQIAAWLVQLDAPAFAVRESASESLKAKGIGFVAELQAAIQTTPSLEVKSRLETLVEHLMKPPLPNVWEARAIELLERIGTADAQTLLAKIAAGEPTHALTQDAAASLKRLQLKQ